MKYVLMVRARPVEDIFKKHDRFMELLSKMNGPWGLLSTTGYPQVKNPGTLPMEQVTLTKCFRKGIKALVSYQNRKYQRDEGKFDDYFTIQFDPAKTDYQML